NTGMLQLVDRSSLFKILDHVGIFGDVAPIASKRLGGHLLHGGCPPLVRSGRRAASTREGFQAGGDHDLQVPLSKSRVSVFPIEHLALFGKANFTGKITDRLSQYRGMGRPSPAPNCPSTTMKETQLHLVLTGRAMELAVNFVQFPNASQHATIFIGIRIAEHDFLPTPPGIEQGLILWIPPDPSHDRRGTT